jgi:hypothetical protein
LINELIFAETPDERSHDLRRKGKGGRGYADADPDD